MSTSAAFTPSSAPETPSSSPTSCTSVSCETVPMMTLIYIAAFAGVIVIAVGLALIFLCRRRARRAAGIDGVATRPSTLRRADSLSHKPPPALYEFTVSDAEKGEHAQWDRIMPLSAKLRPPPPAYSPPKSTAPPVEAEHEDVLASETHIERPSRRSALARAFRRGRSEGDAEQQLPATELQQISPPPPVQQSPPSSDSLNVSCVILMPHPPSPHAQTHDGEGQVPHFELGFTESDVQRVSSDVDPSPSNSNAARQ